MVVIKIPQEIKDFKEKAVFGLTVRQLICCVVACVLAIPTYVYTKDIVGTDIAQTLVMIVGAPIILIGFYEKNGKPIEKYLWIILKFHIGYSKTRIMDSQNFWEQIIDEADEEEQEMKKIRNNLSNRKDKK